MMRRVPDISKIRALVGYKPRADLNDILASVIDYHRLRMLNEVGVPAGSLIFQLS
jgi:nucleoside-diphosphate-sugar epimerase